jgi:hypothetical protein
MAGAIAITELAHTVKRIGVLELFMMFRFKFIRVTGRAIRLELR